MLVSIRNRVKSLLKQYPECRDNKELLIQKYVDVYYRGSLMKAIHAHAIQSVHRERRYIQNTLHQFEPSIAVRKQNKINEKKCREVYR